MYVLSVFLIVVFIVFSINHYVFAYQRIINKKEGYSYVPLINGVIGGVGLYLSPIESLSKLWWIAFITDWGCMPLFIEYLFNKFAKR